MTNAFGVASASAMDNRIAAAGTAPSNDRICFFMHDLRGGGAERNKLRLIDGMIRSGRKIDLVLVRASGEFFSYIPAGARVIDLNKKRVSQSIFAFARYLRRERPKCVLASLHHINLAAILPCGFRG